MTAAGARGLEFLDGGGELGALMRARDWSRTPLGEPAAWPQSLKTAVAILLHSPVPMVLLWGEDGIMLYNDAYSVFAGGRHPRLLGSKVLEGWPEVADFNANVMRVGLAGGTLSYRDQHLVLYRNGAAEDVWMNLDYSPVPDDSGRPAGVLAIVVESTARVVGERHLRAIVEATPECVKVVAPDGALVQMNPSGLAMVGAASAEAVIGKPVFDLIAPEDRERFRAFHERICRGERGTLEFDVIGLRGERRQMETHAVPLPRPDGTMAQLSITRDVTERRRADDALRDSERRYRAVVESQAEMVCRFRADGTILFVNNAYARARGTSAEALAGRSLWDFVPEEDRPAVRAMLERLTPEAPEVRIENRFETADGPRWTLWTNRALAFDEAGRLLEAQSTGIDISARRRAEDALREADRRKDEFIATLSHELRNPLAPLRNALHVLRAGGGEGEGAAIVEMMERQVNHLVRLVDDLLEMSRISRGALELRREPVEIAAIVANAVESSEPLMRAAGHRLTVSAPQDALWVDGDAVRLAQILANLLNNAAKFTDRGGEVALRVRREGGAAVICVRDNGRGIAPEALPRLFEMFSRADRTSGGAPGGLGIGLALARRLAEMHGGTLQAASEGPGKGAEFTLRVPLARPVARAAAPPRAGQARIPARRVLVVDDNRDAAESLGLLLRHLGAEVRVACAGHEALEAFQAYDPAVVLLDLGMPGMDGYEVARRLRAHAGPGGRRVPIVALTGWGQEDDRQRTREAGFDHHLIKPADIDSLRSLLSTLA